MKVGDLVRHKRRGWLAIVLSVNSIVSLVRFVWIDGNHSFVGELDSCSTLLFEVISEL
jgi:hypothetical protein